MGQILHGSAKTTEAIRRAIQNSQESLRGNDAANFIRGNNGDDVLIPKGIK